MPKSRVNGGRKVHRRVAHKRAQLLQAARREIGLRGYMKEIEGYASEIAEHHQTVHADCPWPKEPEAEPAKEIA